MPTTTDNKMPIIEVAGDLVFNRLIQNIGNMLSKVPSQSEIHLSLDTARRDRVTQPAQSSANIHKHKDVADNNRHDIGM